jgi:hypothetical protein
MPAWTPEAEWKAHTIEPAGGVSICIFSPQNSLAGYALFTAGFPNHLRRFAT